MENNFKIYLDLEHDDFVDIKNFYERVEYIVVELKGKGIKNFNFIMKREKLSMLYNLTTVAHFLGGMTANATLHNNEVHKVYEIEIEYI